MPIDEPEPPRQTVPPRSAGPTRPDDVERQPAPPRRYEAQQRREDILIAAMAGLLAWVITLALKMGFSG